MKNTFKHFYPNTLILTTMIGALAACGGGDSNSGGGPSTPPPSPAPLFTAGIYSGTATDIAEGQGISTEPQTSQIRLEVRGSIAGSQQVGIAFAQFSGTSAILRDGSFSIPSGPFPIPIRTRAGVTLTECTGDFLYDGVFANNAVTGTLSTTSEFVCARSDIGPLTITGTFEASLSQGSSKVSVDSTFKVIAENF